MPFENGRTEEIRVSRSRLEGAVKLSGAKNSALRLMAASLLTEDSIILENFPASLLDVGVHAGMLEALGKSLVLTADKAIIKENTRLQSTLNWEGRSIRNTLLILGALTTRFGFGKVPLPGGCKLGERKYDLHVMLLENLGARVWEENDYLCAESVEDKLVGADIQLPIRSTGATENAILAASLAEGQTVIWNPHIRPEILDLIALLTKMGANITVQGQQSITVTGVDGLRGTTHQIIPDNMEAITWAIGATITGGEVEILDFPVNHLEVPLVYLRESGMNFYRGKNSLIVRGGTPFPIEISTGPYPGINSDMQPLFAVFGACARGTSKIVDLRFPGRYGYAKEFNKMGLKTEEDGDMLVITGGDLTGSQVVARNLRAGMALTLGGMVADGTTTISEAWQIERGYDRFHEKMNALGGQLEISSLSEALH